MFEIFISAMLSCAVLTISAGIYFWEHNVASLLFCLLGAIWSGVSAYIIERYH